MDGFGDVLAAEAEARAETGRVATGLVMVSDPSGPTAEAIRALRTHLVAQHLSVGRRTLAICGFHKGAGCSFVAANLAAALSQIGVNTLLIDADLRRPSVRGLIGVPSGRGLADYLADPDASFSDCVTPEVLPSLSVMLAGQRADRPQELLAGARFRALIEFCSREYEVTVVDTPAADTCADARRVSTVAGYSLVVARRNATSVADVRELVGQLADDNAKTIGAVLNDF